MKTTKLFASPTDEFGETDEVVDELWEGEPDPPTETDVEKAQTWADEWNKSEENVKNES